MTDNQSTSTPFVPSIHGEALVPVTDAEVNIHLEAIKTVLEDKKAIDLAVLDLREKSAMADYFVVCSGNSRPHTRALSEAVYGYIKDTDLPVYSFEGRQEGTWILLDLGFIVVHVMQESERAFYNLEQLWTYGPEWHKKKNKTPIGDITDEEVS